MALCVDSDVVLIVEGTCSVDGWNVVFGVLLSSTVVWVDRGVSTEEVGVSVLGTTVAKDDPSVTRVQMAVDWEVWGLFVLSGIAAVVSVKVIESWVVVVGNDVVLSVRFEITIVEAIVISSIVASDDVSMTVACVRLALGVVVIAPIKLAVVEVFKRSLFTGDDVVMKGRARRQHASTGRLISLVIVSSVVENRINTQTPLLKF